MHLSAPRCASFCYQLFVGCQRAYAVLFAVKLAKPNSRKTSTPEDIVGRSNSRVQGEGDYEAARRYRSDVEKFVRT
jgi:hypothetical protein